MARKLVLQAIEGLGIKGGANDDGVWKTERLSMAMKAGQIHMREMRCLFLSPMMVGAPLNNMIEYTRKMINYTCSMRYLKSRNFFVVS